MGTDLVTFTQLGFAAGVALVLLYYMLNVNSKKLDKIIDTMELQLKEQSAQGMNIIQMAERIKELKK